MAAGRWGGLPSASERATGGGRSGGRGIGREVEGDAPTRPSSGDVSDIGQSKGEPRQQARGAYDRATLFLAASACVIAIAAALFTCQRAGIARCQTRRSLRAYAVVEAEPAQDRDGGRPHVKFTAENTGSRRFTT